MTLGIVLVLIGLGLLLILVELFFIPGTTVVGIAGFIMCCIGIYGAFVLWGTMTGFLVLIGTLVVSLGGLIYAIKKKYWKMFALNNSIEEKVIAQDQSKLEEGQLGVTVSALRPGGTVSFDDKYFEVFSSSEFVDVGQKVKITSLSRNKISVEKI